MHLKRKLRGGFLFLMVHKVEDAISMIGATDAEIIMMRHYEHLTAGVCTSQMTSHPFDWASDAGSSVFDSVSLNFPLIRKSSLDLARGSN